MFNKVASMVVRVLELWGEHTTKSDQASQRLGGGQRAIAAFLAQLESSMVLPELLCPSGNPGTKGP